MSDPAIVPATTAAEPITLRHRIRALRERHARLEATAFFAGGFGFDAVMVQRIDDRKMLIQQGVYLVLVGLLLGYTLYLDATESEPPRLLKKVWPFSEHVAHFMLGTLLNAFAIFYLKSASGLTAVLFLVVISALLAVNELPYFHKLGPVVLLGLYAFCLSSFLAYLVPELAGHIRGWMFFVAEAIALVPFLALGHLHSRWVANRVKALREVVLPGVAVLVLLGGLFALRLIPPVPLAVQELRIYHQIAHEKGGHYTLTREKPAWWQFWRNDDRDFLAREGDRVYAFVRVFAPTNFKDRVYVRWLKEDEKRGWVDRGALPLSIVGGREEGFRGYAYKAHYEPGDWRVQLETEDGRIVGQLGFTVDADASTTPREWVEEKR